MEIHTSVLKSIWGCNQDQNCFAVDVLGPEIYIKCYSSIFSFSGFDWFVTKFSGCTKATVAQDCGPVEECISGVCHKLPCSQPVGLLFTCIH